MNRLDKALREIKELKSILRDARHMIEAPGTLVLSRRRVLEEIDKAL